VFLDAGNTFFKSTNPPDYLREQWLEQAKGVVEAYNLLKATAITPGETDFALGTNTYLNLVKAGDFKVVSANLVRKETGKLLFPASTIVEKNGVRLGIFGVYSPDLSLPDDLSALPVISSAKAEVQKLKNEKVDLK
jgi:2',3'-cyclic-nucleotide 2'-phosphodiesterase (5'-nucleotidase family)